MAQGSMYYFFKKLWGALTSVAQFAKGHRFDSWSGHTPGLQVWSPIGVSMRDN